LGRKEEKHLYHLAVRKEKGCFSSNRKKESYLLEGEKKNVELLSRMVDEAAPRKREGDRLIL